MITAEVIQSNRECVRQLNRMQMSVLLESRRLGLHGLLLRLAWAT